MPKAVISNRVFIEVTPEQRTKIIDTLTYKIPGYRRDEPPSIIKTAGIFKPHIITVPSGRVDLIPEGHEVIDKRVLAPVEFPEFQGTLRPSQQAIYDAVDDNCIINAFVSFGKTFTGLAIAGKLGQKTLVVTHTVALRNQWVREIEKVYGFTPGIIGSGKFQIDTPIVVGNVQTLYNKIDKIFDKFGLVILDEMHHTSAPTFSRILDKTCARYKIGLSGTVQRKDGKHVVFKDYFSSNLFQPPAENYMVPTIHIYESDVSLPDNQNMPWANKVNEVAYNQEYQHSIAILAAKYAAIGHKVLVVSDRVGLLQNCAELIGSNAVCVTGEVPHEERDSLMNTIKDGSKNVLLGTQSIFSEGISVNELSCIVLATPVNNEPLLTQLIGRVIRESEGKLSPVVVDIQLRGRTAARQANARLGLYIKQGWKVIKQ